MYENVHWETDDCPFEFTTFLDLEVNTQRHLAVKKEWDRDESYLVLYGKITNFNNKEDFLEAISADPYSNFKIAGKYDNQYCIIALNGKLGPAFIINHAPSQHRINIEKLKSLHVFTDLFGNVINGNHIAEKIALENISTTVNYNGHHYFKVTPRHIGPGNVVLWTINQVIWMQIIVAGLKQEA